MSNEQLVPVPGFSNYAASRAGDIYSLHFGKIKKLKPGVADGSYLFVHLYQDGRKYTKKVHYLILITFHGPRPEGMECRHFPDRNPANCHADNVSWGSSTRNKADKIVHGTNRINIGESHGIAKLTDKIVLKIRAEYIPYCPINGAAAQARKYNVGPAAISEVIRRRNWKHI